MPIFRADFDVRASLVLPDDSPPLTLCNSDGKYQVILRNSSKDGEGFTPRLNASVIGPCEEFDNAARALGEVLATQLDMLTYVTQSKFEIQQCRCLVDWEPYQKERRYSVMQKFDGDYPPHPELDADLVATANALNRANSPTYVLRALHFFRLGMLNKQLPDQFQQFWLALETIAEGSKDRTQIAVPCQHCKAPLTCEACHRDQRRTPMAMEAIQQLLKAKMGDAADECFRQLRDTRHHLSHGRSAHSRRRYPGQAASQWRGE